MKKKRVKNSRKPTKIKMSKEFDVLVRNNIIFGAGVAVSLMVLAMTVMMFAAPSAGDSLEASLSLLAVLTYPLVVVISILLSLILKMYGRVRLGMYVSFLPAINVGVYLVSLFVLFVRCGGRTYC